MRKRRRRGGEEEECRRYNPSLRVLDINQQLFNLRAHRVSESLIASLHVRLEEEHSGCNFNSSSSFSAKLFVGAMRVFIMRHSEKFLSPLYFYQAVSVIVHDRMLIYIKHITQLVTTQ